MAVIETQNLCRLYGRRVGVESIDLSVDARERFGFLGPNGAGKTTTIRVLMGLMPPTSGSARVLDQDSWQGSTAIRRDVGYLPGDLRLYPWLTGNTAIRIAEQARRMPLVHAGRALADRFRLDMNLRVRKMSRGTRQKLGLILALVHQPRLLILDEPTSGLDPLMREALTSYLHEYSERGNTVFFSSHTLSEVEQLCDRVAIVRDGRIVADQRIDHLRNRARRNVRIQFADRKVAQDTPVPEFLIVRQTNDDWWDAELAGDTPALVNWAARQALRDLTISRPDLGRVFQSFYDSGPGPSCAASS